MYTIVQCVNNMDMGGVEQLVLSMGRVLKARGFGVAICCIEDRGALADQAEAAGIPVHALHMTKRGKLTAFRDFCAFLRRSRESSVLGLRSSVSRLPVVIHSHNFKPFYYSALAKLFSATDGHVHSRHGSLLRRHPAIWRYRLLRPWVNEWVTVSADRQTELATRTGLPADKIHVLANGVDTTRFCPAADKAAVRAELGLPADSPIIICVARLAPEKDLKTLLRAFKILSDSWVGTAGLAVRPETTEQSGPLGERALPKLVLVGAGPCMAELRTESNSLGLAGQVDFLGARNDVHRLLQAADVFALSSLSEGLSVALIEAAACGLPIVATEVGGNYEVVNAPHGGQLVPVSNPESLATALIAVLTDSARLTEMQRAARAHALQRFSLDQMVDRYLALYEKARRQT